MNLASDFKGIGVVWRTALLAAFTAGHILAQGVGTPVPVGAACLDLNQTAMAQMANGKLPEAELAVSAYLVSGSDRALESCAGLVLNNMAAFLSVAGRLAEAERLAERSVLMLEKAYSPDHVTLLHPLQVLAAARFELGKTARAREALRKMQAIRAERPEDQALVHGMAAALLEREGRRLEAEAEYLAAFRAWEDAGKGKSAEAATILNGLGSLYIELGRLTESQQTLDRALAIFSSAKDTVTNDYIKLHEVRGVLHAWQGAWREAEQDFRTALSMADRELWVDPIALRLLLTRYAYILRKNHHGQEARSIEKRAAALHTGGAATTIVDITELFPKAKPSKK
jgi:tetratricopeptide (TPR) repeat protein